MKKFDNLSNIILVVVFLAGLSLLLYPSVSDYWNSFTQSQAIAEYSEQVAGMNNDIYDVVIQKARDYNKSLLDKDNPYLMTNENKADYQQQLNVSSGGVLGYIEIPSINVSLPIYHGVDESVLQVAVGHIEWTSLPVGGESTHSVISGHRGLPSAKLFTELDRMETGDTFVIRVLDEVLTYEVDQILIVEPHEVKPLSIVEGQDLVTLVTCTPYGINSHRLLVRGHRVENQAEKHTIRVTADAMQIEPYVVAPVVALPMLLVLLAYLLITTRKKR